MGVVKLKNFTLIRIHDADLTDDLSSYENGCDIIVSEFELKLHYYFHFRIHAHGKGMNLLIPHPTSYWLNDATIVLFTRITLALNNQEKMD